MAAAAVAVAVAVTVAVAVAVAGAVAVVATVEAQEAPQVQFHQALRRHQYLDLWSRDLYTTP